MSAARTHPFTLDIATFVLVGISICGCATLSPDDRAAKRVELDQMADATLAKLQERDPDFQELLERSIGYAVVDMAVAKIPMIGTGSGLGLAVDKRSNKRTYLKVSRFDLGSGIGAQKYKIVITFDDPKLLDRALSGTWHYEAGVEAGAGSASMEGAARAATEGYRAFRIVESGAVAIVTVRLAHAKPYLD